MVKYFGIIIENYRIHLFPTHPPPLPQVTKVAHSIHEIIRVFDSKPSRFE